jgi:hypothetical protein
LDARKGLCSDILKSLHSELLQKVEQSPKFRDELSHRYDPLLLMELIRLVCQNHGGLTEAAIQNQMWKEYWAMKQMSKESVESFYDRMRDHVMKMSY